MVFKILGAVPEGTLEVLATHYGPIAFGAIMLLAVWRQIVKPELDSGRVKTEELRKVAELLNNTAVVIGATATTMSATANTMNATAGAMGATATAMAGILLRLEKIHDQDGEKQAHHN